MGRAVRVGPHRLASPGPGGRRPVGDAERDRRPDRTAAPRPARDPLSRRRVQKLARETVTLDHLSNGRLTLGVGLGSSNPDELVPFGEVVEPRERARLLDHGLSRLAELWAGEFEPPPVQHPRIPVWVAGKWPNRRPLARAAAWDGMFPIELPGPDALAELAAEIAQQRPPDQGPFD